jgi:hypothetical protein
LSLTVTPQLWTQHARKQTARERILHSALDVLVGEPVSTFPGAALLVDKALGFGQSIRYNRQHAEWRC